MTDNFEQQVRAYRQGAARLAGGRQELAESAVATIRDVHRAVSASIWLPGKSVLERVAIAGMHDPVERCPFEDRELAVVPQPDRDPRFPNEWVKSFGVQAIVALRLPLEKPGFLSYAVQTLPGETMLEHDLWFASAVTLALLRAEREATRAARVTHEINNLLTGLIGDTSLALFGIPEWVPGRETVEGVLRSAQRASELTAQLLAVAPDATRRESQAENKGADMEQVSVAARAAPRERVVLVIDDEPWVRATTRRMLEHLGYRVVEAADGLRGLETFSKQPRDIAAVLVDLTMPEMSGEEVVAKVRALRPSVPVIVSSGYTDSEATAQLTSGPDTAFLAKPYTVQQLSEVMRRVMPQD